MKVTATQQKQRDEVRKIRTALMDAVPVGVSITSILVALAEITAEFTHLLIKELEKGDCHG